MTKLKLPEGWRVKEDALHAIETIDGARLVMVGDQGSVFARGMCAEILLPGGFQDNAVFLKKSLLDAAMFVLHSKAADLPVVHSEETKIVYTIAGEVQEMLDEMRLVAAGRPHGGYLLDYDAFNSLRALVGAWERAAKRAADDEDK